MQSFDKRMALEVIEDAFMDVDTPHGRGVVTGLCGAFHMCGLFDTEEWAALLQRIPLETRKIGAAKVRGHKIAGGKVRGRYLN